VVLRLDGSLEWLKTSGAQVGLKSDALTKTWFRTNVARRLYGWRIWKPKMRDDYTGAKPIRAKAARIPGKFAEILCWNEQESRPRQSETLMKSPYLSLALSLSLTILVGCSSSKNGGQPPPPPTSFAESWHFDVSNSSLTIDAALTLSSNSIAGVAHVQSYTDSSPCPGFFDDVPLSGTIDGQGHVSIKSSAVMGVVLSLNGVLASDRASLSNGSYQFAGGCDGATGPLTGVRVKPLTGLYAGTMQWSGNTVNVSAQLTQASQSDRDGLFGLSGTVTLTNSCAETFTLNGASVVGAVVHLYSNTGTGLDGLTGVMDPEAQQIELDDYLYSDDCIAGAHGVVTRQ